MGANLNARKRSGGGRRKLRPIGEINVTPFVDVMLVLLIVFMVTAPLLAVGIPVDLPETSSSDALEEDQPPLVITVQKDGTINLQKIPMEEATLIARLQAIVTENPGVDVYVRGDREVTYGEVVRIMDMIKTAGIVQVKLVTRPADET